MKILVLLIFLTLTSQVVLGANVIMFLTLISRSMKNIFLPLAQEMVKRGHTVTLVTPFAAKKPSPGIKEIILEDVKKLIDELGGEFVPGQDPAPLYSLEVMKPFKDAIVATCEFTLAHPEIQGILAGKEKFDLFVLNLLYEDCAMGMAKKLNLPFIYVSSYGVPVEHGNNLRIPSCMPYCPAFTMLDYTNKMSFWERAQNSFTTLAVTWLRERYFAPAIDDLLAKRVGPGLPPILDIERNVSLIILNDHFSITYARPLLPNIVQAACMHCRPAKELPKDIASWVDGSGNDGFIYFSLGSLIPAHKMPKPLVEAFVEVFSKVKSRVIWKIDLDNIPNLPSNVRLFKWLPQQDLLGHPKLRLFMTHGGLLSVQESAYHGVPMLGFPTSIDQPFNMRAVESSGAGVYMDWRELTKDTLYRALNDMLTNPIYKQNAVKRQSFTRDLENTPLDTAVFWLEYVIRHNGAPQLRTGGLSLTWYQYYQVDLLVVLATLLVVAIFVLKTLFKMVWNLAFPGKETHEKKD